MRNSRVWMVVAVASSVVVPALAGTRSTVDRIVAVIEGEIITWRELEAKAKPFMAQLDAIEDPKVRAQKRRQILHKVLDIEIGEKIVAKEISANQERLGVTQKDVDKTIEEVLRHNNMDREQLQAALYTQGLTWSEYRTKLRDQIERARLIQFKVQGRVDIKEAEVKRLCLERQTAGTTGEQVCVSHILIAVKPEADAKTIEAARGRAAKLQAEVSAGAGFAAFALEHSDDKSAPDGDLGCFGAGEMVEAFEKASFAAKVGEVTAVVRTEFGFHIIRVNERKAGATPCRDEADLTPFRNEVYQRELERQMNVWIAELRKKAFVEVRL